MFWQDRDIQQPGTPVISSGKGCSILRHKENHFFSPTCIKLLRRSHLKITRRATPITTGSFNVYKSQKLETEAFLLVSKGEKIAHSVLVGQRDLNQVFNCREFLILSSKAYFMPVPFSKKAVY